jgi:DNA-binding FrmR family transcriptional regulator
MQRYDTPQKARIDKKRLARIEGHVKGIRKMIDEYKSVQQISAVRAPLDGVIEVMVQDLVEYYVSQTADNKGKNISIKLRIQFQGFSSLPLYIA